MASTGRLFRPSAEGSQRDPLTNAQMNGNIMNPPRFAELGGLSSAGKSFFRNTMRIVPPGASTRNEPARTASKD